MGNRDIELLKHFYIRYFGATSGEKYHNPTKGFSSYFLNFDDNARLELMHRNDIPEAYGAHLGLAHLSFSVGGKEAVDELTQRLRADEHNVISNPRTTGDGYYENVIADPEGNIAEITI